MSPKLTCGTATLALFLTTLTTLLGGCATTQYQPQLVARGELTLRYDGGFVMQAQGKPVASGLSYRGLDQFVACVPEAHRHARSAQRHGGAAVALSVLGVTFSLASLGSLVGLSDSNHMWTWLGAGLGAGSIGLTLSALSWREKNQANGHALDAMNHYNDTVGSLGATCQDLRYPPAAGPSPADLSPPATPTATDPAPGSLPPPPSVDPSSSP